MKSMNIIFSMTYLRLILLKKKNLRLIPTGIIFIMRKIKKFENGLNYFHFNFFRHFSYYFPLNECVCGGGGGTKIQPQG